MLLTRRSLSFWLVLLLAATAAAPAQQSKPDPQKVAQKVVIDTDIGDDIDDAYALALAMHSPELDVLGVTTAWGDTALRARLVRRLLAAAGHGATPVQPGAPTHSKADFSQRAYATAGPAASGDGVGFLLAQARRYPHQVTLVALGPFTNVGAAIDRDPASFRLLKRVVIMGGSIRRGYRDTHTTADPPPEAEYNIASDPAAARKLFTSGVPIFMMPLDSTQWKLDDAKLATVAARSTPVTDALLVLTTEWQLASHQHVPILYDVMAMAYAIRPEVCPMTPLHVQVDDAGFTRVTPGQPNAQACLTGNGDAFFQLLLPRLAGK